MLPTLIYPPCVSRQAISYFAYDALVWTLYMPVNQQASQPTQHTPASQPTQHTPASQQSRPTLISLNNYLPGLLVSIYSAKKQHEMYSHIKYVVLATHDVPEEALQLISKFADHIWLVRYITRPVHLVKDSKFAQRADIDLWINSSYTKFNALALPYKKIVLLDCDTICLGKLTPLLLMNTPAACYANINHVPFGNIANHHAALGSACIYPAHGEKIPRETIIKSLTQNGTVFSGAVLVLSPNLTEFNELLALLDRVIFSNDTCLSKPDEQCLATFYMRKKIEITNIEAIYNAVQYSHAYLHRARPVLLHYPGINKPWLSAITDMTIKRWHEITAICAVVTQTNALKEYTMCKNLTLKLHQDALTVPFNIKPSTKVQHEQITNENEFDWTDFLN
jgi:lipopolysaccharide biosynthesis glycosyltransferase